MCIESGFLIVKTFPRLYRDYVQQYGFVTDSYSIPRIDKNPEDYQIQYRGLDRDALDPYEESELLAEIRMAELEKEGKCEDGFFPCAMRLRKPSGERRLRLCRATQSSLPKMHCCEFVETVVYCPYWMLVMAA